MCEIRTYRYHVRAAEDEISVCALTKTILPPHNFWAAPYGNSSIGSEYSYVTYFNNQLNAQILLFYNNMYVTLQSSTCFEH
jgi:hypothetical protein